MSNSASPSAISKQTHFADAAHACEACRLRKAKCDKQRPKCSLCERLDLDCKYSKPKPMKKDKSLRHMNDTIQRLESKVDSLLNRTHSSSSQNSEPSQPKNQFESATISPNSTPASIQYIAPELHPPRSQIHDPHKGLTYANRIFMWPAIQSMLVSAGADCVDKLHGVLATGTDGFVKMQLQKHPDPLPSNIRLHFIPVPRTSYINSGLRVAFPDLTAATMKLYTNIYFNSFNMIYPILERGNFMQLVLPVVLNEGFGDGCMSSIMALSVFALGKLAIEGALGESISSEGGIPSGIRGGDAGSPPALDIFNEVRRRLGSIQNQWCLEATQVLLLTAIYYETSSRHIDCWRTLSMASQALQILLRSRHVDWVSHKGDLTRRVFWTCYVFESWYRIDLDLPETGLSEFVDEIALPLFVLPEIIPDWNIAVQVDYQYNFLSMIAIRRLIDRVHEEIYNVSNAESEGRSSDLPMAVVQELTRQLNSWRASLPESLQWRDTDRSYVSYDADSGQRHNATFIATGNEFLDEPQLTTYNSDILTAHLRGRFYYCRLMLYRPFIYKALHLPNRMTNEDKQYAVNCLDSCLQWPICMGSPKNKKRLIPNIYVCTQSFLMILLILKATQESVVVREVCNHLASAQLDRSISSMLEWIKDMKQVDGIAEWGWKILEPLYSSDM